MKSGIYVLSFSNGAQYAGQAKDIDARLTQHAEKLNKRIAATKLQEAFNECGMPFATVIIRCHPDFLNTLEAFYIDGITKYSKIVLNTTIPQLDPKVDYAKLVENESMLKYSIAELVQMLGETKVDNCSLIEVIAALKKPIDKELYLLDQKYKLNEYKANHQELSDAYREHVADLEQRLNAQRSKSFWQRLFNT